MFVKKIVIIFILYTASLISQTGSADLRCLQILSNGDTKLTWIASLTSTNSFLSYEIYRGNSLNGSYSLKGTIGSVITNTFIDSGAPNSSLSLYYFVLKKSIVNGTIISISSDTLKTIFLTLSSIPGAPDLKINYNEIHQPKLASSSTNYTILKEYPIGTWSIFGNTNKPSYADTISVCQASLNYQITLSDNSGCISNSRILGGIFKDIAAPDTAQIDSISVLPNGNTILSWKTPRQNDVSKYQIYLYNGTAQTLAIVNGRQSNAYIYTITAAQTGPVSLLVAAIDSCNNPGGFDKRPTSIFLKTSYNKCAYQTKLEWNNYINIPKGLLEYRIYYSENGAAFTQIWSTSETSYLHTNVTPNKNICYFVRAINKTKTITSTSNKNCFFSKQVESADFVYIKTASIISKTSAKINFLIDSTKTINGIEIQRSTNGLSFSKIGYILPHVNLNYTFIDESIISDLNPYYYRVVVKDSCGNYRTSSNMVKTIFLKVEDDKNELFVKHLSWNCYEGFNGGTSGYSIYRVLNDNWNTTPIGYTNSQTTNFIDNLEYDSEKGSKIDYVVIATESIVNQYNSKEISFSNQASVFMEGRIYVPNSFSPNGVNKTWAPVLFFIDKNEYHLTIYNRWGKIVFESTNDSEAWDGFGCKADIYTYLIKYKNSIGEMMLKNGCLNLIK